MRAAAAGGRRGGGPVFAGTELGGNVTQGEEADNKEEGVQDRGLRRDGRWDPERQDGNQFKSVWVVPVVDDDGVKGQIKEDDK